MLNSQSLPRIVPWSSWQEWEDVYRWLYSPNYADRALGVKRVGAWKSRCKVALSVECTATFVEIDLNDNLGRSENEKRMMYSMALTRMINGLIAPFQKSMYAVPIGQIAAKIGLPPSLVDWRHQASHNQMPSIAELREACRLCLEWLDVNYWRKQNDYKEQAQRSIHDAMEKYKDLQKNLTANTPGEDDFTLDEDTDPESTAGQPTTPNKGKSKDKVKGERKKVVADLLSNLTANQVTLTLIPLLVDGQYLVPKKKRKLRKYKTLPTRLKKMWSFFIKKVASEYAHFIPTLLCVIVDRIFKLEDVIPSEHVRAYHRSILLCWFQYFASRFYPTKATTNGAASLSSSKGESDAAAGDDFSDIRVMPLATKTMISICLRHPNRSSLKIIRTIKPIVELLEDPKEHKRIGDIEKYLLEIVITQKFGSAEAADAQKQAGAPNFFTEESIPLPQASSSSSTTTTEEPARSIWVPVKDITPGIGLLPNGQLPVLNALPIALDDFQLARFLISEKDSKRIRPLAPIDPQLFLQQAGPLILQPPENQEPEDEPMSVDEPHEEPTPLDTLEAEPSPKRVKTHEEPERMHSDAAAMPPPPPKEPTKSLELFVSLDDFI